MKTLNSSHRQTAGFLSLLLFASLPAALPAQTYEVVIDQPPSGFVETQGHGVSGQQRVGTGRMTGGTNPDYTHALLWMGVPATVIDLHPPGWTYSKASATDGTRQVGYVEQNNFPYVYRRAALWSGTPGSLVLLTPANSYSYSEAFSLAGDQQVGYVDYSFEYTYIIHATLWRGTPASRVDLHPTLLGANSPGDQRSKAFDTDGTSQVGYTDFIIPAPGGGYTRETRAMLWHNTAESAVILHPTGWDTSYAYGVKNDTQVGYGFQSPGTSPAQALVWHGTAESVQILGQGTARDTNGSTHVGTLSVGYNSHAFRWDGDSGSGVDLHNLLPPGYSNSGANDIDEAGNIIGWAQTPSGYMVSVWWRVVTPAMTPAVVSRKLHSGAPFDLNLPLSGSAGIECRSGSATNDYQLIFTFPSSVTFNGATVTAGMGAVSSASGNGTSVVTVNLSGITNAQRITLMLSNVSDGTSTNNISVPMSVLIGDTNGDGFVNSGDALQTRQRAGQATDTTNFRSDVNADGFVNSGDTFSVRARSGTSLP